MAKFCEKCGKPLVDGKCSDCASNTSVTVAKKDNGGFDFNKLVSMLKDTFTKPVELITKETNDDNFSLSWIIAAIGAVSMGLFIMAIAKSLYPTIMSMMGLSSSIYGSLSLSSMGIEIPYFKIFFIGIIVYLLYSLLFSGLLYLISGKLFKGKLNFKKSFVLYQVSSIIMIVGLLVSAILSLVYMPLGLIVLMATSVLNLVYFISGLIEVSGVNKNLVGYTYVVLLVAIYLVMFIFTKIFS